MRTIRTPTTVDNTYYIIILYRIKRTYDDARRDRDIYLRFSVFFCFFVFKKKKKIKTLIILYIIVMCAPSVIVFRAVSRYIPRSAGVLYVIILYVYAIRKQLCLEIRSTHRRDGNIRRIYSCAHSRYIYMYSRYIGTRV